MAPPRHIPASPVVYRKVRGCERIVRRIEKELKLRRTR